MASAVLKPMPRTSRARRYGVLGHDLDGVSAIGLEYPYRPRRAADAVAVQEDHDFPYRLLLGPCGDDPSRAHRANAADFPQAISLRLDDLEYLLAERALAAAFLA